MSSGRKRFFFRTSKYQRPILNLVVILSIITVLISMISIAILYQTMAQTTYDPDRAFFAMKTTIVLSAMVLPFVLLFGILWAYSITHRIIGSFERIICELDGVIEKKEKRHIRARAGDDLAKEVLKRINTLIDRSS